MRAASITVLLAAATLPTCLAFYLPGAAPKDYRAGDQVPLLVNALTPQIGGAQAQLRSLISFDYYDQRFHHCEPNGGPKYVAGSLGGVIFGERLRSSPFDIRMLEGVQCRTLCERKIPAEDAKFINQLIREEYALNWLIDGLPAAELRRQRATGEEFYSVGFQLGSSADGQPVMSLPALHNHFQIHVEYHKRANGVNRVVGVIVWPTSSASADCSGDTPLVLREDTTNTVRTTYSVVWKESSTPWATRWDAYLRVFDPRIHWLSLINSAVLACFLCLMVGMILARTVSKDLARYNQHDLSEEVYDDAGFKLLHGDVFRTPRSPMFLAITVGSGAQLAAMASVTILFALFGFLSPSNRGSLPTVMIVTWTLFAIISGYVSSRLYVTMGGDRWRRNIMLTAFTFPLLLFGALFLLNFVLVGTGSSGAIPFTTMLAVLLLWFGISAPLTFVGSYLALKHGAIPLPARTNSIPRQIPPQPWYLKPWPRAILGGVLPFGAAFIEVYFILNSLFANRTYIAFGFLSLTFSMVVLTTATVSILLCYFSLCTEDHRWAWRSFHTGGGVALWIGAYGLLYWVTRLSLVGFASKVLYLGYLCARSSGLLKVRRSLITLLSYLICGTIGYAASLWFVLRIYNAVRID